MALHFCVVYDALPGAAALGAAHCLHDHHRAVRSLRMPARSNLRSSLPAEAFTATVPVLPTGVVMPGEREADVRQFHRGDRPALHTQARWDIPAHRFVIPTPVDFGEAGELLWSGEVDQARTVTLDVWNAERRQWEILAESAGAACSHTLLSGPVTDEHAGRGVLGVRVYAQDPFTGSVADLARIGPSLAPGEDDRTSVALAGSSASTDRSPRIELRDVPGAHLVVISVGEAPTPEVLHWAGAQARKHAERDAILLAPDYLLPSDHPSGRDAPRSPAGEAIFSSVVAPNPNVVLVVSQRPGAWGFRIHRNVSGRRGHHLLAVLAAGREAAGLPTDGRAGPMRLDTQRGEVTVPLRRPLPAETGPQRHGVGDGEGATGEILRLPVNVRSRTTSLVSAMVLLVDRVG